MIKKAIHCLIILVAAALPAIAAAPSGDWKLHPTFDNDIIKIVDTPKRVYMQVLGQPYSASAEAYAEMKPFLFAYDKEADEMLSYNRRNYLSANMVSFFDYNPEGKYLLVVYDDNDIDFIYDDGRVYNVPGLKLANMSISKKVNFATFDPSHSKVYLATDFGYIVLNDFKHEISESKVYRRKLTSAGRVGDRLVVFDENKGYMAPADGQHMSLDDFEVIEGLKSPTMLMPLAGDRFAFVNMTPNPSGTLQTTLSVADISGGPKPAITKLSQSSIKGASHSRKGYSVSYSDRLSIVYMSGEETTVYPTDENRGLTVSSWDIDGDIWYAKGRKGLKSMRRNKQTGKVDMLTRDYIMPNAPTAMIASDMAYSPAYGMLVRQHGHTYSYPGVIESYGIADLLCGLKDGTWQRYSPAYRTPQYTDVVRNAEGVSIEPGNPDRVWAGSRYYGLTRYDLSDPGDILKLTHPGDPSARLNHPGFVALFPDASWKLSCHVSTPEFDPKGNMWFVASDYNAGKSEQLWALPAADVAGLTAGNASARKFHKITLPHTSNWATKAIPAGGNYVLVYKEAYDEDLILVDHKGTLDNTSDDKIVTISRLTDSDGSTVRKDIIRDAYYDAESGHVWIATNSGVFYLSPRENMANPGRVHRVKISRNDGTNLADYLLDGVGVARITADNKGNKLFATAGGGLLCTSADGRDIRFQLTEENSYLPSNNLHCAAYNPAAKSIMISTDKGLAEFFPAGSAGAGEDLSAVKAYPNPVRPDYYGWITVEGLTDGAVVKIVDAGGNLVRELGPAQGGMVQWDAMNLESRRVNTGVYYVLASSGPDSDNMAKVTSIMVVR